MPETKMRCVVMGRSVPGQLSHQLSHQLLLNVGCVCARFPFTVLGEMSFMLSLTFTVSFAFHFLTWVCASTSDPVAFHKNNGLLTLGQNRKHTLSFRYESIHPPHAVVLKISGALPPSYSWSLVLPAPLLFLEPMK